jgi:ABC-type multidrug transport system ATPase subunit
MLHSWLVVLVGLAHIVSCTATNAPHLSEGDSQLSLLWLGPDPASIPCPPSAPCTADNSADVYTLTCPAGSIGARGPKSYLTPEGAKSIATLTCYVCSVEGTYCDGGIIEPSADIVDIAQPALRCKGGFYCPNTYTELQCPAGYHCREGSSAPSKCFALSICPAQSSFPQQYIAYIAVLGFCGIFVVAFSLAKQSMLRGAIRERLLQKYVMMFRRPLTAWLSSARHNLWMKSGQKGPDPLKHAVLRLESRARIKPMPFMTFASIKPEDQLTIETVDLGLVLRSTGAHVLKHVNVTFEPGKLHGIFGPSGCGKSSLLTELLGRSDNGALETIGVVRINGRVRRLNCIRNNVGFVPQDDVLPEDLTVHNVLKFEEMLRGDCMDDKLTRKLRVEEVEQLLDISFVKHSQVGASDIRGISGGQRKRVSVAMELVTHPSIVIADELTSGLDATTAFQIMQVLQRLCAKTGMTFIVSIHQPRPQIFDLFDNVIMLSQGQVVYQGTPVNAKPYFNSLGFKKADDSSSPDFLLDVVSGLVPREGFPAFTPPDLVNEWIDYSCALKQMDAQQLLTVRHLQARQSVRESECAQSAAARRNFRRTASCMESVVGISQFASETIPEEEVDAYASAASESKSQDKEKAVPTKIVATSGTPAMFTAKSQPSKESKEQYEESRFHFQSLSGIPQGVQTEGKAPHNPAAVSVVPASCVSRTNSIIIHDLKGPPTSRSYDSRPLQYKRCKLHAILCLHRFIRLKDSYWENFCMSMLAIFAFLCSMSVYEQSNAEESTVLSAAEALDPNQNVTSSAGEIVPVSNWNEYVQQRGIVFTVLATILLIEGIISVIIRMSGMSTPKSNRRLRCLENITIGFTVLMIVMIVLSFIAMPPITNTIFASSVLLRLVPWAFICASGNLQMAELKQKMRELADRDNDADSAVRGWCKWFSLGSQRTPRQTTAKVQPAQFAAGTGLITPSSPATTTDDLQKRKGMPFMQQCIAFFYRSLLQHVANTRLQLLYLFLLTGLGIAIGILYGPNTAFNDIPLKLLLAQICLSLVAAASGMQLFNREMMLYYRERAGGTSAAAYFIAKNLAHLPVGIMQPVFFLISYISLSAPAATFGDQFAVLLALQWASAGVGMFVGILLRRDAAVAMVCLAMLFALFNTFNPRISYFSDDLGMGKIGARILVGTSYVRWTSEALLVAEIKGMHLQLWYCTQHNTHLTWIMCRLHPGVSHCNRHYDG